MSSNRRKRLSAERHAKAAALGHSCVSRNDKCPCGSGKKAKKCCLNQIKFLKSLPPRLREQVLVSRILGTHRFIPTAVPPAVAERFAAVQAQAGVPGPAADTPVESATIQQDGGDPIQLTGGTLALSTPEAETP